MNRKGQSQLRQYNQQMLGRGNTFLDRHVEHRHPRQYANAGVLGHDDPLGYHSDSTDSEFALFREEEAKNKRWKEKSRGVRPSLRQLPIKSAQKKPTLTSSRSQHLKVERP